MRAHPGGAGWERLAERYLAHRGLSTLARNFHCRLGEIDLVMFDGETLVFVEVRYRRNAVHGSAAESVGVRKRLKIQRAAGIFLNRRPALAERSCRFDVVGISGSRTAPRVEWLRGAFELG